jgi:hypothetical protein
MPKITWNGDAVAKKINEALLDGTEEWLTVNVKTNSVGRTPWREGILAGSHTVQRSDDCVVLGVGGPASGPDGQDVGYALINHEDASLHHERGEDHYLEKAANDCIGELPGILQKRVKAVL